MSSPITLRAARQRLRQLLTPLYGERESTFIADWVLEQVTGWSKEYARMQPDAELSPTMAEYIDLHLKDLLRWRPVQYVLGEAWFMNMRFKVDERVLIPRPETEELVEWVTSSVKDEKLGKIGQRRILDIGTGSGCIPIALKANLPEASIWSLDASEGALALARENARILSADVHFLHLDVLKDDSLPAIPEADIIVSNPPYVLEEDRADMRRNVIDWEPHMALFVEGSDPLLFYHRIADLGLLKLSEGGQVFVEIQETMSDAVVSLFRARGYREIEARRDLSGRDRMVKARKA
ncbi:MAG: peptide chain release factor N(5)-glutamine methyltransferase [Chitinophagaceae bacterium]|jgi:release factor glutamine methyltransferase|nr:peptide chain release factor N(5)-glutamine methyltransferase [Chitinophagaceae bacterium]